MRIGKPMLECLRVEKKAHMPDFGSVWPEMRRFVSFTKITWIISESRELSLSSFPPYMIKICPEIWTV